jgi:hypothetical protein
MKKKLIDDMWKLKKIESINQYKEGINQYTDTFFNFIQAPGDKELKFIRVSIWPDLFGLNNFCPFKYTNFYFYNKFFWTLILLNFLNLVPILFFQKLTYHVLNDIFLKVYHYLDLKIQLV